MYNNNDVAANFVVGSSSQVGIQIEGSDVAEPAQSHPIIDNALLDALALQGDAGDDGDEDVLGLETMEMRLRQSPLIIRQVMCLLHRQPPSGLLPLSIYKLNE